jgi:putative ABC transport system substrate-binding protein
MRAHGYVDGESVVIERHYLAGSYEISALIREFDRRKVQTIVAWGPLATEARKLTSTIPIVFISVSKPMKDQLISSLARPGGNFTGITNDDELDVVAGKYLELLKAIIPSRIDSRCALESSMVGWSRSVSGIAPGWSCARPST